MGFNPILFYESGKSRIPKVFLSLGWNNITNASILVGDAYSVSDWNTFFDLPTNGTPFSSVKVVGNEVHLFGGANIQIKSELFGYNINLLSVVDTAGCVITAGESCFYLCPSVTEFNLPSLVTAFDYCFAGTTVTEFNLPSLVTAYDGCFSNCSSATSFNLPSLVTAEESCFNSSPVTEFNLPSLLTAGDSCFSYCTAVITFDLPQLTIARFQCFYYCIAATSFILPSLVTAGEYCFYTCPSVTAFDLPLLETAGESCFQYCSSATSFELPSCTNLGGSVFDDSVFLGISGHAMALTVPTVLLTCNSGDPDGDIQNLIEYNTVGINSLILEWDSISNADILVGDAYSVSDWNTFFELPLNGTPFSSVVVIGNKVKLFGGAYISVRSYLFNGNTNLLSIVDTANCVTSGGDYSFSACTSVTEINLPAITITNTGCFENCTSVTEFNLPLLELAISESFLGCTSATSFILPSLVVADDNCFVGCSSVVEFNLPQLINAYYSSFSGCTSATSFNLPLLETAAESCFEQCTSVTEFNLPSLVTAGYACFRSCSSVTEFNLPSLVTAYEGCFSYCSSATSFNLPQLTIIGDYCFNGCGSATSFYLPSCIHLGTTVYNDDGVFASITGNQIVLDVPAALLTCDSGLPDKDIQNLTQDNTVAINPLVLEWDSISNADILVGDAYSLSDWNTFFDLPVKGTPFSVVVVVGNKVKLGGGAHILLKNYLFSNNEHLLSVVDNADCITSAGNSCFQGCVPVTTLTLPGLETADEACFKGCVSAITFELPSLKNVNVDCFKGCSSVIEFSLPSLVEVSEYCFQACSSATTFNLPKVVTTFTNCFAGCSSVTTFNLPLLETAGEGSFAGLTTLTIFDLPSLVTAYNDCFIDCTAVTEFILPSLTEAGNSFAGCVSVTSFNLPSLVTAYDGCFSGCVSATTFDLPLVETIGSYAFYNCGSATSFYLPSCTHLGGSTGNDNVFDIPLQPIPLNTIALTVSNTLLTCKSGDPDGDIQDLIANNHVTINPGLKLGVINPAVYNNNISYWNTFFDLPANGTPFRLVTVIGNEINLSGGSDIHLKNYLFNGDTNLVSLIDTANCVITAGEGCFKNCTSATTFNLPQLTTIGDYCFLGCSSVTTFNLPQLVSANGECFPGCTSVALFDLPSLEIVGDYTFYFCTSATTFNLPSLVTAGTDSFYQCTSATTFNLPSLVTLGDECFRGCNSATSFELPSCTNLGTTTDINEVFGGITGKTITLSVPAALLTCNGGDPDGDIQNLKANNTVKINSLVLEWDNIANAAVFVGDYYNVSDWNSQIVDIGPGLTPFSSVRIIGNKVKLFGGSSIRLQDGAFSGNQHLISVNDTNGCVTTIGEASFSGCSYATTFNLPALTATNYASFYGCIRATSFNFPSVTYIDSECFISCISATSFDFPLATSISDYSFNGCVNVTSFNLPNVQYIGLAAFAGCSSVTSFYLPSVINTIAECFSGCTAVTSFYLPLCTNLGGSVLDNNVFFDISGNTITLTVPTSLLTCNSGSKDGDILYLQSNNTVTLIAV